jgi:hypothetical protein
MHRTTLLGTRLMLDSNHGVILTTADDRETYWQIHLAAELVLPATSAHSFISRHCVNSSLTQVFTILLYRRTIGIIVA